MDKDLRDIVSKIQKGFDDRINNPRSALLRLCRAIERHNDLYAAELKETLGIVEH